MEIVSAFAKHLDLPKYKKIEFAGRICYRSESKIYSDSYETFISNIIKHNHLSVLEHEHIVMYVNNPFEDFFMNVFCTTEILFYFKFFDITINEDSDSFIISSNIRNWYIFLQELENHNRFWYDILYKYISKEYPLIFNKPISITNYTSNTELVTLITSDLPKHIYASFHIRTSRSISHQIVRHRLFSFSQESQRYCNYSKDKFNNSIKFIEPRSYSTVVDQEFEKTFERLEGIYNILIDNNVTPEVVREVLPNATATELVVTGNLEQWERFILLRLDNHAQKEVQEIAKNIKNQLITIYSLGEQYGVR